MNYYSSHHYRDKVSFPVTLGLTHHVTLCRVNPVCTVYPCRPVLSERCSWLQACILHCTLQLRVQLVEVIVERTPEHAGTCSCPLINLWKWRIRLFFMPWEPLFKHLQYMGAQQLSHKISFYQMARTYNRYFKQDLEYWSILVIVFILSFLTKHMILIHTSHFR